MTPNAVRGRALRRVLILVIALFLIYTAISPPVAWSLYNLAFFSSADKRKRDATEALNLIELGCNVKKRDVSFRSSNGMILRGWFFERKDTKRVFLVCYGRGGNMFKKLNIARILLQAGGSVLLYDYQGYGLSDGSPSIENVCEDVTAAYDYLVHSEHRAGKDIIGFGESFGTGVIGQLVVRRKVGAAILQSGYSSLLRAGREKFPVLCLYPDCFFPGRCWTTLLLFRVNIHLC